MSWLTLSQIADRLGVRLLGDDCAVDSLNTDTRKPVADALFLALKGENFDAHDSLESAEPDVAKGLIVSRPVHHPAPQIVVDDTRLALGRLAASWRNDFKGLVIGLTGSNGKTTVKEMLAAICGEQGETYATKGNLNNDLGMPLSLLKLREEHEYAILEMGANHPGEIDYLTRIAKPHVALLNNAGPAHLEGFKSLEGVAQSKGEIFSGLVDGGIAVINLEDDFNDYWKWLNQNRQVVTFGYAADADICIAQSHPLILKIDESPLEIDFKLLGEHNVMNAAAAAATAKAAGLSVESIIAGLELMRAVPGRLCLVASASGAQLVDDTYNANPHSMKAAVDVLIQQSGRKVFVVGDMAELGAESHELHEEIGEYAQNQGVDLLFALGEQGAHVVSGFGPNGLQFTDQSTLINKLIETIKSTDSVLVKGSRSMNMDRVVAALSVKEDDSEGVGHAG